MSSYSEGVYQLEIQSCYLTRRIFMFGWYFLFLFFEIVLLYNPNRAWIWDPLASVSRILELEACIWENFVHKVSCHLILRTHLLSSSQMQSVDRPWQRARACTTWTWTLESSQDFFLTLKCNQLRMSKITDSGHFLRILGSPGHNAKWNKSDLKSQIKVLSTMRTLK